MKLTAKIISTISIVLFLCFFVFTYLFINDSAKELRKNIDNDSNKITMFISSFSIEALLVEDYPTVDTHVKNLTQKFDNILCVEIMHNDIKVIGNNCNLGSSKYKKYHSLISYPDIGKIGDVYLYLKDNVDEIIQENVLKLFVYFLVFYVIVLISIVVIIKKQFINKIQKLSEFSKDIANGNYDNNLTFNQKDELEDLAKDLKAMSTNIATKQKNLQLAYEEIKKSKDELEKNQNIIIEQEKMASLGEMIANIAHQWRQPLSAISSMASNIIMQKTIGILDDNDLERDMKNIVSKTLYLSDTIETFRNYIKEKKEYKRVLLIDRLNLAVNVVELVLRNNNIKIYKDLENCSDVYIGLVIGELQQVIINIMNNAKDILLEKNIIEPWVKIQASVKDEIATITIEDNAGGIPEDIIGKIFDPYFTTKHQSQGTGLGLHMSHKIITESLKGNLYVKNSQNGAKFFIELPL